jgi:proline-specific peptidase
MSLSRPVTCFPYSPFFSALQTLMLSISLVLTQVQWYTIFGDLKSSVRPLICLHGGPGAPHNYLLPIRNLVTTHKIPVIMYDQLGCGNSTHLPEKNGDGKFWTVDLFLSELDNLLSHLGIQDDYDLLGQSWGGMLGASHVIRQPKGLKKFSYRGLTS